MDEQISGAGFGRRNAGCQCRTLAALGLLGIYVETPEEIGPALDRAFAHDGPSVVEVRIDDRATPIHSFKRRLREKSDTPFPRPGTVYKLRGWKVSPDLAD
jgi:acetolactate synthase-1/2/3 large subunit